jgi:hypothetical protein
MVWIDDVVADLEIADRYLDFEVFDQGLFGLNAVDFLN